MSRLLAPARIIMPSRVRLTTAYSASATTMQAAEANTRYQGYDISSPSAKLPASQAGALHAVHVVADEQAAHLLEDEDQRVGHQHLLQVFALVEVAEEHPFEQEAEQRRQQHADQRA